MKTINKRRLFDFWPLFITYAALLIVALLFLCSCSMNNAYLERSQLEQDLPAIRSLVASRVPNIEQMGEEEQVIALMHLIHSLTFGDNNVGINLGMPYNALYALISDPARSYRCWGKALLFQYVLRAFNHKSRYVGLYSSIDFTQPGVETHATVEVLLKGQWVAVDATFGVMFSLNEHYLGYGELHSIVKNNAQYTIHGLGWIEYNPYGYLNYVAVYPGPFELEETYYGGWDGSVIGGLKQSIDNSPIFSIINESWE